MKIIQSIFLFLLFSVFVGVLHLSSQVRQKNTRKIPEKVIQKPIKNPLIKVDPENQGVITVSSQKETVLRDNGFFIDQRGHYGIKFDMVRKRDGNFALVYGASAENQTFYAKAVYFTLKQDLQQMGSGMIITEYEEELMDVIIKELKNGVISVALTCTDERSKDNNGNRDKNRLILKYGEIDRNGALSFREVENTIGEYELIELFKPESISEVSVAYNLNGKGKLSKIIPGLSNYELTCHLQKMNPVEINLGREPLSPVNPSINSISLMNDDIFICLKNKFKTPYWNLKENGLNSKRSLKPVWPVYMLSAYGIDNNQEKICYCENDPYTPFDDNQCQPENIVDIFPFNNGNVGIVEKKGANCFFHVFDSQLKRAHPPIQLASNVVPSSIQHFEVRNEKLFLYYNSFDNNKNTFRALVYNWKTGKTEWEKSKILWEDVENREREYKLVPYDNHRFVAVSFSPNSGTYSHQATMEYRVLNVN